MRHLTRSLVASAAAMAVLGLVSTSGLVPLVAALAGPGTDASDDPRAMLGDLVATGTDMTTWKRRIDGRSLFLPPPMKPVKREEPEPPEGGDEPDDGPTIVAPPPPPPRTPPGVSFIVGREVSFEPFAGEATVVPIRVGDEVHGLRVVEVRAPWTVRVLYDGVEHVIEVFGAGP